MAVWAYFRFNRCSYRYWKHLAFPTYGRCERVEEHSLFRGWFFLFIWSIPLVIAEYAMGKRSRTGTIGTFRIFAGKKFAWMGLWTAWISTAIGFYYAVVSGWTIKYFQLGITGALNGENVDTTEVWNAFLQNPGASYFLPIFGYCSDACSNLEGCESD